MFKTIFSVIKQLIERVRRDDLNAWASQLTFYTILSIFPFLIFLTELINRISFIDMTTTELVLDFLPDEIQAFINLLLRDLFSYTASDTVISLSIIAALWSSSKGIMAIIRALNRAYDQQETRSFVVLRLVSVVYTLAFALLIILVLVLIVFGGKILDVVMDNFPFLLSLDNTFDIFRYLISLVFTYWFFIVIYNVSPNQKISIKDVTPGALFATVAWLGVSTGFSLYVGYSKNLSYFYGSLTSIIILLLWLYVTSLTIMIGGEINAIILNLPEKEKKSKKKKHFPTVEQEHKNDGNDS